MGKSDRPVRIALIGASGTGKTTLATHISTTFGIPMNPHGSRSTAAAMGFGSPYDVDRASKQAYKAALMEGYDPKSAAQISMIDWATYGRGGTVRPLFQTGLQKTKIEWERANLPFVTDRTTIDDLCYALLHCVEVVNYEFLEAARAHMAIYDLVVYCPAYAFINLGDDPARLSSRAYHTTFDIMLSGFMHSWDIMRNALVLDTSDLNWRCEATELAVRAIAS
jgi:hypothetical protein